MKSFALFESIATPRGEEQRHNKVTMTTKRTGDEPPHDRNNNNEATKRRKVLCIPDRNNLVVDEDLHRLVTEIELQWYASDDSVHGIEAHEVPIWNFVESRAQPSEKDVRLRICECPNFAIGKLTDPLRISLRDNHLPPIIGKLKNLQELDMRCTCVADLPDSVGDLTSLTKLNLGYSRIASLPSSIGRLENLQELDLGHTVLSKLPDEIGDLGDLIKLVLDCTRIKSLPNSIGKLHNLEDLCLHKTRLQQVPKEIGNLSSLKKLDLSVTMITTLPASVGELKNLDLLDLHKTKNLLRLPEEIGDVSNLKVLNFDRSGITLLPESVKRLKHLLCILVGGTSIPELQKDPSEFLLQLTHDHPFLGCLDGHLVTERKKVLFGLACNRARFWTGFGTAAAEEGLTTKIPMKLWPLVLQHANLAFQYYPHSMVGAGCQYLDWGSDLPRADAICCLLADDMGRESFLLMILAARLGDTHCCASSPLAS